MLSFLLSDHCSIVHYLPFCDLMNHAVKGRNQWSSPETKTAKGKMFSCSTILWSLVLALEVSVPLLGLAGGRSVCSAALSSFFCWPQKPCAFFWLTWAIIEVFEVTESRKKTWVWLSNMQPGVQDTLQKFMHRGRHVPGKSAVASCWDCSIVC